MIVRLDIEVFFVMNSVIQHALTKHATDSQVPALGVVSPENTDNFVTKCVIRTVVEVLV